MSDILADYREWRDAQPVRVSTHSAGCHMWHERCMIDRLADALGRARLTDAEREAVAIMERVANRTENLVVGIGPRHAKSFDGPTIAATLRTLLERTR
jgi:hypothetical protein